MPLSIYRDQRQRDATLISPLQRDAGNSHVQVSNARNVLTRTKGYAKI